MDNASVMHTDTCVGCRTCKVREIERSQMRQRIHQCYNVLIVRAIFVVVPAQADGCEVAAPKVLSYIRASRGLQLTADATWSTAICTLPERCERRWVT